MVINMNRLHKKISCSLQQKLYIFMILLLFYGWYKNGWIPYFQHFYSLSHLFLIFLYPLCGFGIGILFDVVFKNKNPFNNKFYGFLFSLFVPISTNIFIFILLVTFLLFLNTFLFDKKDWDFNFIVFGKLLLFFILLCMKSYEYTNLLEKSQLFVYTYIDGILGHQVSGLFTSNALLILFSFSGSSI